MVIPADPNPSGKPAGLPWESIDPVESEVPTQWEPPEDGDWFLEPPPGAWEMEGLQAVENESKPEGGNTTALPVPPLEVKDKAEDQEPLPPSGPAKGGWAIVMLCVGLGMIAACLIVPQAEGNRRLVYEREKLRLDLAQIQNQVAVNKEFLSRMENDPQLIERLASREMRAVPQGETVLDVQAEPGATGTDAAAASVDAERMSPFMMINVPPPPPLKSYRPVNSVLARLYTQPKSQLYLLGAGMFLAAAGLVLGDGESARSNRSIPTDGEGIERI